MVNFDELFGDVATARECAAFLARELHGASFARKLEDNNSFVAYDQGLGSEMRLK